MAEQASKVQKRGEARRPLGTVRFNDVERAIIEQARGALEPAVFVRWAAVQWARYLLAAQAGTPLQQWADEQEQGRQMVAEAQARQPVDAETELENSPNRAGRRGSIMTTQSEERPEPSERGAACARCGEDCQCEHGAACYQADCRACRRDCPCWLAWPQLN